MADELDNLATEAAKALISAMVSDTWAAVKDHFSPMVRQRSDQAEDSRQRLAQAAETNREQITDQEIRDWTLRLRADLVDTPNLADALSRLLATPPSSPAGNSGQAVSGDESSNVAVQTGAGSTTTINQSHRRTTIKISGLPWAALAWAKGHLAITIVALTAAGGAATAGVVAANQNSHAITTGFKMVEGQGYDFSKTPPAKIDDTATDAISYSIKPTFSAALTSQNMNIVALDSPALPTTEECKSALQHPDTFRSPINKGTLICFSISDGTIGYLKIIDFIPQWTMVDIRILYRP